MITIPKDALTGKSEKQITEINEKLKDITPWANDYGPHVSECLSLLIRINEGNTDKQIISELFLSANNLFAEIVDLGHRRDQVCGLTLREKMKRIQATSANGIFDFRRQAV